MKIRIILLLAISFLLYACAEDNDDNITPTVTTSFNFTHNWNETAVTSNDFNTIQYTNENGESLSIEKLRYLISDITFTKSNGEQIVINDYNLVDLTNDDNLTYSPNVEIPTGTYSNVSFTFGFDNNDNIDGEYQDLNSASWNVPAMLGGGYHYMQYEGKFINEDAVETGYAYHAIRAVDRSDPDNLVFQDTFFNVDLGAVILSNNATFEIKMNIAEWFKNPITWNLNDLHSMMMPNFDAQVMIHNNGQSVFSLGTITQ
jgi:hypothetical protein